jgi:hypothetical protein
MTDKRLNAWISEDCKDYLMERAGREKRGMNKVITDMIRQERAREQGAIIEQHSLPIIRDIVQTELKKQLAQLRLDLREDMQLEFTNEIKALLRAHTDRLAALIVRTFRHANITQRLTYAMLSKSHGIEFARHAFEDASEKAGRDLAARSAKEGESA